MDLVRACVGFRVPRITCNSQHVHRMTFKTINEHLLVEVDLITMLLALLFKFDHGTLNVCPRERL